MSNEAHLIDMFQFVDDLIDYRVRSLHFDLRVGALSLDPVAHHTQRVAVNDRQTVL